MTTATSIKGAPTNFDPKPQIHNFNQFRLMEIIMLRVNNSVHLFGEKQRETEREREYIVSDIFFNCVYIHFEQVINGCIR